jgi:folate-binding protein YgfZ
VLSYGDVPAEYAAGIEGCLLFDQTDRGLVLVAGADRTDFLHRLLSNDVRGVKAGRGNRNLLLSPKGKVLFDFDLAVGADAIRLSVPPGRADALLQALETYHFAEKVQMHSAPTAALGLCGKRARECLLGVWPELPELPLGSNAVVSFEGAPVHVSSLVVAGSAGFRIDGGPELVEKLWKALLETGARPAGLVAYDILRVEAGAAEPGVDIDESIYPQEARLEQAFNLEKGCYVGQEVVAKIDTYGGLNKRLVGLQIGHDEPVPAGTRLLRTEELEQRDLGVITSWTYSFALDSGMALGYVKRRHQAEGTTFELSAGLGRATIVKLPVREGAVPVTGVSE